jgi:hypothetical protein
LSPGKFFRKSNLRTSGTSDKKETKGGKRFFRKGKKDDKPQMKDLVSQAIEKSKKSLVTDPKTLPKHPEDQKESVKIIQKPN